MIRTQKWSFAIRKIGTKTFGLAALLLSACSTDPAPLCRCEQNGVDMGITECQRVADRGADLHCRPFSRFPVDCRR